jgi:hypothetical protein
LFNFADGLVSSLANGKKPNHKDDDSPQGGKKRDIQDQTSQRYSNDDNKL